MVSRAVVSQIVAYLAECVYSRIVYSCIAVADCRLCGGACRFWRLSSTFVVLAGLLACLLALALALVVPSLGVRKKALFIDVLHVYYETVNG